MKGLFIKDFRIVLKIGKAVFFILGLFILLTIGAMIFSDGENHLLNTLFGAISGVVAVMPCALIMGTFSIDESSHWNDFARSMPTNSKEIVLSKYLFLVLTSIINAVFIGVFFGVAIFLGKVEFEIALIYLVIGIVLVSMLFGGLFFPVAYKFGPSRGRIIFAVICIVPTLLIFLRDLFPKFSFNQNVLMLLLKLSPIFVSVIFIASIFLSYRIFVKKPF